MNIAVITHGLALILIVYTTALFTMLTLFKRLTLITLTLCMNTLFYLLFLEYLWCKKIDHPKLLDDLNAISKRVSTLMIQKNLMIHKSLLIPKEF